MTWDIYGNPLQRGHCEVHPHVHEDYPCSVCISERVQTQQPHDALQQLQYEFAQQGDYIKHLKAERDALAAQVEFLRSSIDKYQALGDECILREALTKTPQQCLRYIQAEAGRVGYFEAAMNYDPDYDPWWSADQYAESVRQGGE